MVVYSKVPHICETCGREVTKIISSKGYIYYVCHPCKHKADPKAKERTRDYYFKKKGKSREWYEKTLEEQGGVCAICKQPETATSALGTVRFFNIDHNHRCCRIGCNKCIRGLLCTTCNKGIGHFKESPQIMLSAIEYLKKHLNDLTVSKGE